MLFGETVAVYCENHTEHTDTVRTSQEPYGTLRYSPYLTGNSHVCVGELSADNDFDRAVIITGSSDSVIIKTWVPVSPDRERVSGETQG
jgi:hypothetical protein